MADELRGGRRLRIAALALGTLALGGGVTLPARAASVTDAQAQELETQLRTWLGSVFGPHLPLGDRPIRLTAQDDHFALEIPVAGPLAGTKATIEGAPVTATLRPLDGGRWAVEDVRYPSPVRLLIRDLPGGGEGVWTAGFEDQDLHATLDPSLATSSIWDGTIRGYRTIWRGPGSEQKTEAADMVTHIAWQPVAAGRIDLTEQGTADLLSTNRAKADGSVAAFSAARVRMTAHVDALAPNRLPPILQAAFELWTAAMAQAAERSAAPPPHTEAERAARAAALLTPQTRAALEQAIDAIADLLTGFNEAMTLDDVRVHVAKPQHAPIDAAFRKLDFGMGIGAPEGRLRLRLHFAMDGFDSAAVPAGKLHAFLPRHIAFSPRVGGVPAQSVLALLRAAVRSDGHDPLLQAQAEAMLRDGPLALGIDDLSADFGPAALTASGEARISGPADVAGEAHVAVTGLDALIHDATSGGTLKMGAAVLIFLKGIGQQDGAETVWNVAYSGGRLTVNGTDVSQLIPRK